MTWTDEQLVEQFREATYIDGSPLTARARAWVAVKAVRDADVWAAAADKYLVDGVADADDYAAYAYAAYAAWDVAYAAHAAAHAAYAAYDADAATYAARVIRRLDLDDPTLARYIREALAKETDDLDR